MEIMYGKRKALRPAVGQRDFRQHGALWGESIKRSAKTWLTAFAERSDTYDRCTHSTLTECLRFKTDTLVIGTSDGASAVITEWPDKFTKDAAELKIGEVRKTVYREDRIRMSKEMKDEIVANV